MNTLTLFYDGNCPLCRNEMTALEALDKNSRLEFQDIQAADFQHRFAHINTQACHRVLHAQTDTGELLLGLEVSNAAWNLVAPTSMTAFLFRLSRWPGVRVITNGIYRLFARYRYAFSFLLTGQRRCNTGCQLK